MTFLRPGVRRLFRLETWRANDARQDLRDEMELHIALRAEQLQREGHDRLAAEAEARRLFAIHQSTVSELEVAALDRNQHMRLRERWDALWQDTRYAARRLTREPATTAFIIVTLAVGIGVNVTAFNVVDRVLMGGPQHVRDPARLVRFYSRVRQSDLGQQTMSWLPYPAFTTLRTGLASAEAVGAYRVDDMMVGRGAASQMRRVSQMSSEMFSLLGVRPVRGRFYGAMEDSDPLAVIEERMWRNELGADPDIVGKSIIINDVPRTVVGVAPAGFTGAELGRVDAWIPIGADARNSQNMHIIARLRPGVAPEAVATEVERLRPQVEASLPRWAGWLKGATYLAAPIRYDDAARESVESVMARWLAVISAIILFISCANVTNLLLARLARRKRELAVRMALGSGRQRVARLLILEGILLAVAASIAGILVVALIEPVVRAMLFPQGSWSFSFMDARIVSAIAAFALVTALMVSIAPSFHAGRADVSDSLRGGSRAGEGRSLLRSGLTVVQAMLSVILLVGAGLFLRSIYRMNAVDLGLEPGRVVTVEAQYERPPRAPGESVGAWLAKLSTLERERHRVIADAVRRVSGVERAAVSVGIPFNGGFSTSIFVAGRDSVPVLPGGGPHVNAVDAEYFATIGTPIRAGRGFTSDDREGTEPVIVINETMARVVWPGRSALGECVQLGKREAPCARVVGIAADTHRSGLQEEPSIQLYVPIGQERGFAGSFLLVRPSGRATAEWPALRRAILAADPSVRSLDLRVLSQGLDDEKRPFRLGMMAFGFSAGLAMFVAGLGLYSVMSHAVAWRRHEIGVRLALGARPGSIAALVVRRGTTLATAGIGLGLLGALAARPWLEPHLFQTSARDPLVLVAVIVVLEMVAIIAGLAPARRAVRVSPTEAMRAE